MNVIPCYTQFELPVAGKDGSWEYFQKTVPTKMMRMRGQFKTQTREGLIECRNGYLAVDSGGFPYPIDADEHERTYVPAATPSVVEAADAMYEILNKLASNELWGRLDIDRARASYAAARAALTHAAGEAP